MISKSRSVCLAPTLCNSKGIIKCLNVIRRTLMPLPLSSKAIHEIFSPSGRQLELLKLESLSSGVCPRYGCWGTGREDQLMKDIFSQLHPGLPQFVICSFK